MFDGCRVCRVVDALREARDHDDARSRAVSRELGRAPASLRRRLARPDDRDTGTLGQRQIAHAVDLRELEQQPVGDADAIGPERDDLRLVRRYVVTVVSRGHREHSSTVRDGPDTLGAREASTLGRRGSRRIEAISPCYVAPEEGLEPYENEPTTA